MANRFIAILALSITPLFVAGFFVPAMAQGLCGPRPEVLQKLSSEYQETPVARGLANNGQAMVELLTSKRGTWTIIVTGTGGQACLVATGQAWQEVESQPDPSPLERPGNSR